MINVQKYRDDFSEPHHLLKSVDGIILFLREWPVANKSETAVLILHGITAYSEAYSSIGETLSKNGYTTYGLDLRGHGRSDGNRGDYPSREMLHEDLRVTLDFINTKHKKLVILGHSLGVVTSLEILINKIGKVDGLVLLSLGKEIREEAYTKRSVLTKLKILISTIFRPSHQIIHYYREGMVGLDDPLFNFYYTLRFLNVYYKLDVRKLVLPDDLPIPLYMAVGDEDEIFSSDAVKAFYDEMPSSNKEFNIIKNTKHAEFAPDAWENLAVWLSNNF